jgi:quercetin dioxygenase-like cupin family protein
MTQAGDFSAMRARRIITGHDDRGNAVVVADEQLKGSGLAEDRDRDDGTFFQLWATHQSPVDNSDAALEAQKAGSATTIVGSGHGTVLRIGVLGSGLRSPMHRTESVDYGICLEGECDMELDGGDTVTVRAGDVVIQRGTNHVWHNRSDSPCKFVWVLVDAQPIEIRGKELRAAWVDAEPEAQR